MELNQWEKDNNIEYSDDFLKWYKETEDIRTQVLTMESAQPLNSLIAEYPERERAYWLQMKKSGEADEYFYQLSRDTFFKGELQKIHLVTNMFCFGPCPKPDEEMEQRITITRNGRAWLSRYGMADFSGVEYKLLEKETFKISADTVNTIFDAVMDAFSKEGFPEQYICDISPWNLELTDSEGRKWKTYGYPIRDVQTDCGGLSDIIRRELGRDDLLLFDGNPDHISRIEIKYHRITKSDAPTDLQKEEDKGKNLTWDYSENLTIDSKSDTITHFRQEAAGCRITNTYYVDGGVSGLLDGLDPDLFMDGIKDTSEFVDKPLETKDYEITISTKHGDVRKVTGKFDKDGLPADWPDFIKDVFDYIASFGAGEIFDSCIYGQRRRRKDEYIFCNVVFSPGGRKYCYLADEDIYYDGEKVIVPVGEDNHEAIGGIVSIEYHTEAEAPYPLQKIKHIIRKSEEGITLPDMLIEALRNVSDSYEDFVGSMFREVRDSEENMKKLLEYIEENPDARTDEIIEYVYDEILKE